MRKDRVAIGIDLGTSKCCVAVVRNGKVEIVENECSNRTTPSYVAFTETERLIGDDAKDQVTVNPTNTVFGVKGLIGRNYDQALAHCRENSFPYELENDNGKPKIKVQYLRKDESLAPEQVSAMLLAKMKQIAESYLGCGVTDAVISVPGYFNNFQRLATKAAAEIAGLNVLSLINEPTAAAIAFKVGRASVKEETLVMLDIGGGTFDAAVIKLDKSSVEVVRVEGDRNFGGQNFDNFLIDHFVDLFRRKHGKNLKDNKQAVERLRDVCSKIKHTLTLLPKVCHTIECILGMIDFDVQITRNKFELLFLTFIKEKVTPVLAFLPAKDVHQADHVVPIGGSTRIPKLQTFLKDFFGKNVTKTINIDEAVAYGAAFQAALLVGDNYVQDLLVLDQRSPHIIDVIPTWEEIRTLIPRSNKALEWPRTKSVPVNGETTFFEFVYNADRRVSEYNHIGTMSLAETHALSREAKHIPIQYRIDDNGVFRVEIADNDIFQSEVNGSGDFQIDIANQRTKSQKVNVHLENIPDNVIQKMREQERMFEQQKQQRLEQTEAFSELEKICFQLQKELKDVRPTGSEVNLDEAMQTCDGVLEWLDDNPEATLDDMAPQKQKLEKLMMSFFQKI